MKRILAAAVLALAALPLTLGQTANPQAGQGQASAQASAPELYHIHVVHAAPGKLTLSPIGTG